SRKIYDALLAQITKALAEGDTIKLSGFGSLQVRQRKARPAPGQAPLPANAPPQNLFRFRPASALKSFVAAETAAASVPQKPQRVDSQERERQRAQFETHYNVGIAYKEMSLYEFAIQELESAIKLIETEDKEHHFIQCCSLI